MQIDSSLIHAFLHDLPMEQSSGYSYVSGFQQPDRDVYKRQTISGFLQDVLGVSAENADEDACHIEHVISEETFQKLMDFKNKYAK